jgi:hypothetical protein
MARCARLLLFSMLAPILLCAPPAIASDVVPVVAASGTLQKCLGITPGAARMTRRPSCYFQPFGCAIDCNQGTKCSMSNALSSKSIMR